MFILSKKISDSQWFQNFVIITILIAGVATYETFSANNEAVLELLNNIILGVFIAEILVKILAEGKKPWLYFTDAWNIFDFIIVGAAFLPFGGSSIAILRLLRLLRVLKLIKALPKLQMLVGALLKSLPSMGYVSILLTLLFYIYAVAGVFFFGKNDPIHFGDLQTSMLSLFRIVTLEDWTDIMYINMYGCENYGYDGNLNLCTNSTAASALSITFFVTFVLIGTMIFLNLFIGVVMNGMDEAKNEMLLEEQMKQEGNDIKIEDVENKITELEEVLSLYKVQQKISKNLK